MGKTTVNGFVVPANYKASIANFHTPSEAKRKLAKLDEKYKQIRIAQLAMDNELERRLLKELEGIER